MGRWFNNDRAAAITGTRRRGETRGDACRVFVRVKPLSPSADEDETRGGEDGK